MDDAEREARRTQREEWAADNLGRQTAVMDDLGGRTVLAADMDTNPGLAYSVGVGGRDISLPEEALEEKKGAAYGWQLKAGLLPREAVERYAVTGPDGVRLTGLGKIGDSDKISAK